MGIKHSSESMVMQGFGKHVNDSRQAHSKEPHIPTSLATIDERDLVLVNQLFLAVVEPRGWILKRQAAFINTQGE